MPPEADSQLKHPLDKKTKSILGDFINTRNSGTDDKGVVRLSTEPIAQKDPLVVGDNDGRVPTQGENDALVGDNTDIDVGSGNKYVTQTGFQDGAEIFGVDAEASDTYAITLSPVPAALHAGMTIRFSANTANTGAATLNVNSLGAKTIKKLHDQDLETGDIEANQIVTVVYNADDDTFQMQSQLAQSKKTDVQTFTGSGEWTKPSGAVSAFVQAWGGGGGSGGVTNNQTSPGAGGSQYVFFTFLIGDLGSTETVTIGVGGIAGASGSNAGGDGGDTTFGSLLTAVGGTAGNAGSSSPNVGVVGGGTGIYSFSGGAAGQSGLPGQPTDFGGGGSGGGSTSTAGKGGDVLYGGGGGGGGSELSGAGVGGTSEFGGDGGAGANDGVGNTGVQPGGGAGGSSQNGTGNRTGGVGGTGRVIVTTYF